MTKTLDVALFIGLIIFIGSIGGIKEVLGVNFLRSLSC